MQCYHGIMIDRYMKFIVVNTVKDVRATDNTSANDHDVALRYTIHDR
jgi:hypothetical protein